MENKNQNKHQQSGGMGKRGVTRPMSGMSMKEGQQKEDSKENKKEHGNGMMMSIDQRREMLHMHHMQTLWIYWTVIILGVWMVMSPLTFDYGRAV
ncbi:MAG: vitamin K epoxide reductase, partial [Fulvivirga sp.]